MYAPITRSCYGSISPAFQTASTDTCEPVTDVCLGPISKVIGQCDQIHPNSGQCWGTFPSKWCNQGDVDLNCLREEHTLKFGPAPVSLHSEEPAPAESSTRTYASARTKDDSVYKTGCPARQTSYGTYNPCPNCGPGCTNSAYNPMTNCEAQSSPPSTWPAGRCDYREPASRNIYDARAAFDYGSACSDAVALGLQAPVSSGPAQKSECAARASWGAPYACSADSTYANLDSSQSYGNFYATYGQDYAGTPDPYRVAPYTCAQASTNSGPAPARTRGESIAACYPPGAFSEPFGPVNSTRKFDKQPFVRFSSL